MDIHDYLELQSNWVRTEYLTDYKIHEYPAISFASWDIADDQLAIINRGRVRPIAWLGTASSDDKSRVLVYPGYNFKQLWVRHDLKNYRSVALDFLRCQYGVADEIGRGMHADHLVPRSRFENKYPEGVTVLYIIPARVNTSWGGGHERQQKNWAMKIRSGITLISVAKSMGLSGTNSNGRTYADIAKELLEQGIISKAYDDARFYGTYSEQLKIETELRIAANDLTALPLKGQSTQPLDRCPDTWLNRGDLKVLRRAVPALLERVLTDNMVARRQEAIDEWIDANQELDSSGHGQRLALEMVFEFLESDERMFPLNMIVQRVEQVLSRKGAAAYLLDQTAVIGGRETFARHDVWQAFDYNWEG